MPRCVIERSEAAVVTYFITPSREVQPDEANEAGLQTGLPSYSVFLPNFVKNLSVLSSFLSYPEANIRVIRCFAKS